MANKKISALTAGNPAQSADALPIARSGANFQITAASITALAVSGTANTVAKFTATNVVGNSGIADDGTTVSITELFSQTVTDTTTGNLNSNTLTQVLNPGATKTGNTNVLSVTNNSSLTQAMSGRMRGILVNMNPQSTGLISRVEGLNVGVFATGTNNFSLVIGALLDVEAVTTGGTTATNEALRLQTGQSAVGGTITSDIGIDIQAPGKSGVLTHHYGINFATGHTGGANNADGWAIFVTSATDQSQFGIVQQLGLTTKYNNIATAGNGLAAITAIVDLTGQTAAVTTTNLIASVPATGFYRVSVYLKVTTAATTSSTLGGTTGVSIGFTDGTDSVAQTMVIATQGAAGTFAAGFSGNTTNIKAMGSCPIYAKTGTAVTYAIDYTSSGATPMAYEARLRLEAL